jgi:hypothetical protein
MSLHTLAKHVQQKGRGDDKMLVHMTPNEVQGLQALAKAHGGSLTINPETGLAEAGFLEQVLPIVAMAAATYFTAGAAAPALTSALAAEGVAAGTAATVGGAMAGAGAGAGVGAIGAGLQGKDVGKGALMGGLGGAISGGMGAYGGAGDVAGEAAKVSQVTDAVNQGAQAQDAIKQAAMDPNAGLAGTTPGMPTPPPPPTQAGLDAAAKSGQARIDALNKLDPSANAFGNAPGRGAEQALYQAENLARPTEVGNIYPDLKATPPAPGADPSYYSTMGTPGKLMTQALPGMTADMGMNTPKAYSPEEVKYSNQFRISPDFQGYTPERPDPYKPKYTRYAANGGLMSLAGGGTPNLNLSPLEQLSKNVMGGQGNMFPQSQQLTTQFATPTQMPTSAEVVNADFGPKVQPYSGEVTMADGGEPAKKKKQAADLTPESQLNKYDAYNAGIAMLNNARNQASLQNATLPPAAMKTLGGVPVAAGGGLANLGSYSDGGRLLKGPGDGMSDNIPAQIGAKQPARLADGEFVVPADVVSHLGNGSTDAGAKRLYAMMDKVRQSRTGKKKQAPAVNMNKFLPA